MIKKTIPWNEDIRALFNKYARLQKSGLPPMAEPGNFVEFIANVPLSCQDMAIFLAKVTKHAKLKDIDVTKVTVKKENCCLFSTRGVLYAAVEIILMYLLSEGNVPCWCYLDEDKKAIVHFVHKDGCYAELYCLCSDTSSALHLISYKDKDFFVPVVFMPQLGDDLIAKTEEAGGYCLQQYLPREKFNCLSKCGNKISKAKSVSPSEGTRFVSDGGDYL